MTTHPTVRAALDHSRQVVVGYVGGCPECGDNRALATEYKLSASYLADKLDAAEAEISLMRDELTLRDELIAAQQETIAALRVEIHLLRRRYGLTPEVAQELLGLVGV